MGDKVNLGIKYHQTGGGRHEMKYDKYESFSEGDNLDKSMDKTSADMEAADMEKYDKNESFSAGDKLDKSEEVSLTQKECRHTFRKLAGDFFDNIHSAFCDFFDNIRSASFWYCVKNVLFNIFVILITALILWWVFCRR